MPSRAPFAPRTLLQDWLTATAAIALLLGLAFGVRVQALQVPGYLLLVGFGLLDGVLPAFGSSPAYDVVFTRVRGLPAACAAVGASVGAFAVLLGGAVFLPAGRVPLAIVTGTGAVLALAGWGVAFGAGRLRA